MGVVYRARDLKLQRDVALKMLPDHFKNDHDRLLRFQREAQILASLNHPNIAQIYGLEQTEGSACIVMELVEGETLAERVKRGPSPIDEALKIAGQLADALEAAHDRGVVHRDLKPANIKVTPDGTVKVLDFGLAKALGATGTESDLSSLPTKMSGSAPGVIMGTAAYMSPEQARGKETDARTDIWAFGCVLFEMLTARGAFEGETATDSIAKIVAGQPDWNLLPGVTPAAVRLLLTSVLMKEPKQRLKHIGDMQLFFDPAFAASVSKPAAPAHRARRGWLAAAVLGIAALMALVPAVLYFRSTPVDLTEMRMDIATPGIVSNLQLSISPDGRRIAYVALGSDGNAAIWIRPIGAETVQRLAGTGNVTGGPFWSPDNRYLAFAADGKLKKIDVAGGHVQVLCDTPGIRGGSWSRSGVILFGRTTDNVIVRVSDSGGDVSPVTVLDAARKESFHATPQFLPDGRHFLYGMTSQAPEKPALYVASLDSKTPTRVMELVTGSRVLYTASGYVLFNTSGNLVAQRFDPARLALLGEPIPLTDDIGSFGFSASDNGMLVYRKGAGGAGPGTTGARQLLWFDRKGEQVGQVALPSTATAYRDIELSPNGDRVALAITVGGNEDIWVIDLARSVPTRITFDASSDWSPSWSPDGSRILFTRAIPRAIFQKASSGIGPDELIVNSGPIGAIGAVTSATRDGRYAIVSLAPKGDASFNTYMVPLLGERKPLLVIQTAFQKLQARVSPDQRWIAYMTNESDANQIVVQTFPDANRGRWQVTAKGGSEPKWRGDSRELYYLAPDGKLMSVALKSDATFEAGEAMPLFQTPLTGQTQNRRYDVAANGERFLIASPTGATNASARITAVVNWTASLDKKP